MPRRHASLPRGASAGMKRAVPPRPAPRLLARARALPQSPRRRMILPPALARRLRPLLSRLEHDETLRRFARGGLAALAIKIGAAGLSFAMFLVLARASTIEGYGEFGFVFSLSWTLAVAGSFGQWNGALKWAPVYAGDGAVRHLAGVIRYGYAWVVGGCTVCALGLMAAGQLAPSLGSPLLLALGGALALGQGLAEYQARLLRALTGMIPALAPRDIGWRVAVIAIAGGWWLSGGDPLSGEGLALISASTLLLAMWLQTRMHPAVRPWRVLTAPAEYEFEEWNRVSVGLWGVSLITTLGPTFAVFIVGLILSPAQTAEYFAALRVAMLLEMIPIATQMVSAAMISRRWHEKDLRGLQKICSLMAAVGSAPSLLGFALFLVAGDWIMGLFGAEFASAGPILVMISVGYLGKAMFGQSALVMQLAGQERRLLRISAVCNLIASAAVALAAWKFGGVGAAACSGAGMAANSIWARNVAMREMGVDTSFLAPLRRLIARRKA